MFRMLKVRELFVAKFSNRQILNKSTIQRIVTRFQSAHPVNSGYVDRTPLLTVLTSQKRKEIKNYIAEQPI
jgi:hypothetical protein